MAKKVLIIESDKELSDELSKELGAKGYKVSVAGDGKEGLELIKSFRPDLIVLCVELPQMSGYSVCNKIRKDPGMKDIPLIIISSEATEETFQQHRKLKTHADEYFIKPLKIPDLLGAAGAFLGGEEAGEVEIGAGDEAIIGEEVQLDGVQEKELEAAAGSARASGGAGEVFKEEDLGYLDKAFDKIMGEGRPGDKGVKLSVGEPAARKPGEEAEIDLAQSPEAIVDEQPVNLEDIMLPEEGDAGKLAQENARLQKLVESLKSELTTAKSAMEDTGRRSRPPAAREQEELVRLRGELHNKELLLKEELDKRNKLDEKVAELIAEIGTREDDLANAEEKLASAVKQKDTHIGELEEKINDLQQNMNRLVPYEFEAERLKGEIQSLKKQLSQVEENAKRSEDRLSLARAEIASGGSLREKAAQSLEAVLKMLSEKKL